MAVRHASLDLSDFETFLKEAETSLASGAVLIPADRVDGELAATFKLDLLLPFVGRYGPLTGQVIQRMPDGSTAARLPDAGKVQDAVDSVMAVVERMKTFLLERGDVVLPGQQVQLPYETIDENALVEDTVDESYDDVVGDEDDYEEVEEYEEVDEAAPQTGLRDGYALPEGMDKEPAHAGVLSDRSLRDTLVDLGANEATGVLTLIGDDGTKRFGFWVDGGPVGWRSDPLDIKQTVGGLLKKSGRLSEEQRLESIQVMQEKGCRQGEALVHMELITQGSLGPLLRKQAEFLLQSALRVREGMWAFHPVDAHIESFAIQPISVPHVLYRAMLGYSKNVSSENVYANLKRRLDARVGLLPTSEPVVGQFVWSDREERFLRLLRTEPHLRVRKIFSLTPMTKADTAGALWALEEMGLLDFGDVEDGVGADRRLARLSGPLLKKANAVGKANLFDVLEVHWICTNAEVKKAYAGLSKRWNRGVFGPVPDELGKALAAIESRLNEAHSKLADDESRRRYRSELIGADMVDKCAGFLAEKGDTFIFKDDRPMAVRCYQRAFELAPASPAYRDGLDKAEGMKRKFKRK
jgi:hypothetical protein